MDAAEDGERQRQDLRLLQVLMAKGYSPDYAMRRMEAWSAHARLSGIEPDESYPADGERWLDGQRKLEPAE